jgi:hypothetical protein
MKSVIQEASSITKAIEKAWEIAGKPKNFSIKIFEEPRRNFFGMVIQSAKVGIFFQQESPIAPVPHESTKRRHTPRSPQPPHTRQHGSDQQRPVHPQHTERPQRTQRSPHVHPQEVSKPAAHELVQWSTDLADAAHTWLIGALNQLGKQNPEVKATTEGSLLTLSIVGAITHDSEKERAVLRSFATLLMQSLRHKLGKPLRGLKLSLRSNEQ